MNRIEDPPVKSITAVIRSCIPGDLPDGIECASQEEEDAYFADLDIYLSYLKNFVDFEEVKDEPIERVLRLLQGFKIETERPLIRFFKFIETRVSLMDNIWQFFAEPDEFYHLNLSEQWTTSNLEAALHLT